MAKKSEKPDKDNPQHELTSKELLKSYVISLAIAIPCLAFTILIMTQFHADWKSAQLIVWVILLVSIANFLTLVALDYLRPRMSSFTMPSLLAACGLVILMTLVEGISRFIPVLDFHWLYPVISVAIIFKYLALFKEKNLALKFYLAMNIIALAALWNLGSDHRVALPF